MPTSLTIADADLPPFKRGLIEEIATLDDRAKVKTAAQDRRATQQARLDREALQRILEMLP